ncbi:bifunctional acetate--CoA ligase family protein/GNAT family N-acetyltransferase [Flindersiella endophytica]
MTALARPAPATDPDGIWALLLDGGLTQIRPIDSGDYDAVLRLHRGLSPDNHYLRFFGVSPRAPEWIATRLCVDVPGGLYALGAWCHDELIGVAHYERLPERRSEAEIAFAVADSAHHRGVATLLLEHLASHARTAGVLRFVADVLIRNAAMLRVFADAGLRVVEHREHDVLYVVAELDAGESYLEAVGERERLAQKASLRHVFAPDSVVVIGASERRGNVGGAILRNLLAAGYAGDVAVVHPTATAVAGVECHPSVARVPFPVDLAVLAVPVPALADTLEACGVAGVAAVVIVTSGVPPELGRTVRHLCHRHGMRLVGPNCLGLANPPFDLDVTFAAHVAAAGRAGLAVQSGGVGIALSEQLGRLRVGVSTFASLGDKYDVSATDLMQWWYDDDQTDLVLLYVESFGNPRKFARVARRLAARKPVLAVDGGRSAPAQRAALSHTAAAATPTAARQALFADAGIIAVSDIGDLTATTALLASQSLPAGPRVAIVSNAGGAGILAADACTDAGLLLPELGAETQKRLAEALPRGASIGNPVDGGAGCPRTALAEAATVLSADSNVDTVLVLPVPTGLDDMADVPWPTTTATLAGVRLDQTERVRLEAPAVEGDANVPVYAAPRDAAGAIAKAAAYAAWRRRESGLVPDPNDLPGFDLDQARGVVRRFLAAHPDGGWLAPADAVEFVAATGVEPVPVRVVSSATQAAAATAELGTPVVMKASGPRLIHKQHSGGVVLGIRSQAQARLAYTSLAERQGAAMDGAIVQRITSGDVELLVGVSNDSVFGPVVAFGLGGTEADALADRVVRLAPLTSLAAERMLREIRAARLLDQAAAGKPVDIDALRNLLLRVSVLAERVPELADLDLNPVLARADGVSLIDVKVRIEPRRPYDPFLRRLR